MFRENVLIALTILITILALSFIILLTVYMQIHQMDERLKRVEAGDKNVEVDSEDSVVQSSPMMDEAVHRLVQMTEAYQTDVFVPKVEQEQEEETYKRQLVPEPASQPPPPPPSEPEVPVKTTTTEDPSDEGFYTDDDYWLQFVPPPKNSRQIPYYMYKRNGHIILAVPDSVNLRKDVNHVKKVLNDLNELHLVQKFRDQEEEQKWRQQHKGRRYPSLHSASLTKDIQRGMIWIRRTTPKATIVPFRRMPGRRVNARKSIHNNNINNKPIIRETFDDSKIFDIVAQNRLKRMGYGRKKRSLERRLRRKIKKMARKEEK